MARDNNHYPIAGTRTCDGAYRLRSADCFRHFAVRLHLAIRNRLQIAPNQQGTSAAATTLLKTLIDANTPASVKVRAAEAIFNHAAKAIEIEDIDARVSELERAAEIAKSSGK